MGKKGGCMTRKALLLLLLWCSSILCCGCNTVGGAAKGAADGAKKDYEEAKKADAWLQENLW